MALASITWRHIASSRADIIANPKFATQCNTFPPIGGTLSSFFGSIPMHFQVSGSRHHLIGPVYRFLRIHKKKTEITICKERRLIVKVILD